MQGIGSLNDEKKKVLHPNDDVNKSQSSKRYLPNSDAHCGLQASGGNYYSGMMKLRELFKQKSKAFENIIKTGRTHFMDATPLSLGQEFSGYVQQIDMSIRALNNALEAVKELALGGTAVGTG